MPNITLPDGSRRSYDHPVTLAEVAAGIGPGLAKAALAARLDDRLVDLDHLIEHDGRVSIVTAKDPEGLAILRHSTAHLLAYAVKELFPEAQVTIGPVIEDGFYYDFAYKRPFTPEDLEAIEQRMRQIAERDEPVRRQVLPRQQAVEFFEAHGERYKAEIIRDIPAGEDVSLYTEGTFTDLCRGPHVPSTGRLRVFKLMKVAGAYWRGDHRNEQLQRIYGTAWARKEDLDAYLYRLQEAERRDHRRLGRELDLFHFQDEAPGLPFWHPRGWQVWQAVEQYMRRVYRDSGYHEVRAPQVLDVNLWKRSGHWDNYAENMFFTQSENREYALKPMNCPGHVQIFQSALRSYRDLPLRYGEFGGCHRNEPSGALHGLLRVRGFTQDDGHIFCTEAQIESEVAAFHRQAMRTYADFELADIELKIALRPAKRIGSDEVWDKAEAALRAALQGCGVPWTELPGEGAFYGPKIEYHIKDSIGRGWQVGTMQVDFMMPERLDANYIDEHSTRRRPVMLHRAILGSMERFIGVLIEHHAGALPAWLAPVQAVVLSITDESADYAAQLTQRLQKQGLRVESDLRNEKISFKIREHSLQKIPYLLVVGEKERKSEMVAVRARGNQDLGVMHLPEFEARLRSELDSVLAR